MYVCPMYVLYVLHACATYVVYIYTHTLAHIAPHARSGSTFSTEAQVLAGDSDFPLFDIACLAAEIMDGKSCIILAVLQVFLQNKSKHQNVLSSGIH